MNHWFYFIILIIIEAESKSKALFISYKQNEIYILNILTLLTIKSMISEEVKKLINIDI